MKHFLFALILLIIPVAGFSQSSVDSTHKDLRKAILQMGTYNDYGYQLTEAGELLEKSANNKLGAMLLMGAGGAVMAITTLAGDESMAGIIIGGGVGVVGFSLNIASIFQQQKAGKILQDKI